MEMAVGRLQRSYFTSHAWPASRLQNAEPVLRFLPPSSLLLLLLLPLPSFLRIDIFPLRYFLLTTSTEATLSRDESGDPIAKNSTVRR